MSGAHRWSASPPPDNQEALELTGPDRRRDDPQIGVVARAIGEGTVRLLLEILHGGEHAPESVTLPHTLTIRSSTAPPRTGVRAGR